MAAAPAVASPETGVAAARPGLLDQLVDEAAFVLAPPFAAGDIDDLSVRPEVVDVPPQRLIEAEVPCDPGAAVFLCAPHVGVKTGFEV